MVPHSLFIWSFSLRFITLISWFKTASQGIVTLKMRGLWQLIEMSLDLRLAVDCTVKLSQLKSDIAIYIFRSVGNTYIF